MRFPLGMMLMLLMTGCAPLSTTYTPISLTIDVRDAQTQVPIQDAVIVGSTLVMFYPEMQDNMFGRPGAIPSFVAINEPTGWRVSTNSSGSAIATVAGGTPTSIMVMAEHYAPLHVTIEIDQAGVPHGAMLWSAGDEHPDECSERTLECRVVVPH